MEKSFIVFIVKLIKGNIGLKTENLLCKNNKFKENKEIFDLN